MGIRNKNPQTQKMRAGRLGGLARVALHGNPGTPEGRRRGGLHSLKTHRLHNTGFKLLRDVRLPRYSIALAELLGILAGDGHVDQYQTTMTTNSRTDLEHAQFVKKLFERLFRIPVSLRKRRGVNACIVVISSKRVCLFLSEIGMVRGNKVRSQLGTPNWIRHRSHYAKAFTRGLFDTDGCVFVDKHVIKGKTYRNLGMAFTNRSLPLLGHFKSTLESIGTHPTQKTKYAVFLRREMDIRHYFEVIGSSNPKHLQKVTDYFASQAGGVG